MNDLDLCLQVVSRSCQPLRYIQRWISRKPLEIKAWFQRTTNRKWSTGYRMVTDDVRWHWKVKLVTPIRLERNVSKTIWARDFKFGVQLCMGNAERVHYFPEIGRGLGHVTPYNFWHTIEHIFTTTWAANFKFDTRLCMGNAEQEHK